MWEFWGDRPFMKKKLTLCAASSTLSRKRSHSNTNIGFLDSAICRSASSLSMRLCESSMAGSSSSSSKSLDSTLLCLLPVVKPTLEIENNIYHVTYTSEDNLTFFFHYMGGGLVELRGYWTSNQNWACFVCCLKNINPVFKNNTNILNCLRNVKMASKF